MKGGIEAKADLALLCKEHFSAGQLHRFFGTKILRKQDWKVFQSHRLHNEWQILQMITTQKQCFPKIFFVIEFVLCLRIRDGGMSGNQGGLSKILRFFVFPRNLSHIQIKIIISWIINAKNFFLICFYICAILNLNFFFINVES